MALSIFDDKTHEPTAADLQTVLGRSVKLWERLVAAVAVGHPPIVPAWNFSGAKFGWSMRLKQTDRVVLYLIPQAKHFLVAVVLGEKAYRAAREAGLPAEVMAMFDAAKPYVEGRGIRWPVRTAKDVEVMLALAALKMARYQGGAGRC
jgi:hypothetical protein